jgi:hypothetical protein
MSDVTYKLREGVTRFAAEGQGIIIEAGGVFETADGELCKWLDAQAHAVERVAPVKTETADESAGGSK